MILADLAGAWTGTNGFRLMPSDPQSELPATAALSSAAGGHLTVLTYTWQHPDDGPQDGLLLVAAAAEGDAVTATWGDSWHQKPDTMMLTGHRADDGAVSLEGSYAGDWAWQIQLATSEAGELRLQMNNVIPSGHATAEIPAGPYPVMLLTARRT